MDAVNDPAIHTVVGMMASQTGKTDGPINNVLGYYIDHDPAPILVVQPTVEMAEAWSKDRLAPMLRDTPCLRGKVRDPKSRDAGNTILHKQFPGGHLTAVGANAPAGLASRPIRIVLADEIDRWPASAGTEGDPLELATQRTMTFWNRKIVIMSTPTVKDVSRIEAAYSESDQRKFWVPCPHCDAFQVLAWKGVHWPEGDPSAAVYRCEACGAEIKDADKGGMLERGQWRAGVYPVGHELAGQTIPTRGVAGFWISALYSPFVTFAQLAEQFAKAKGSKERLQAFVNLKLAETWRDELVGDTLEESYIMARAAESDYSYGEVPAGVAVLVASVDTQNDRLEVSVIGYGPGEESWRIDRATLTGDPNQVAVWGELDTVLARTYPGAGTEWKIRACVVDTGGGRTQAAYEYCSTPTHPVPVIAIKGSHQREAPYIPIDKAGRPKYTVVRAKSGRRLKLYLLGVSQGKDVLFSALKQETPGAGFFNVPADLWPDYARQLTAEVKVERRSFGQRVDVWELKSGRRNEAIDQEVYGRALVRLLGVKLKAPEPVKTEPEGGDKKPPEPPKRRGFQSVGGVRL